MGLDNMLLLAQVTAHVLSFLFAFFLFVPLSVNWGSFQGHCLLFARGAWANDSFLQVSSWGDPGYCRFPVFMGVIMMLASFGFAVWMSICLFKSITLSWLGAFICLVSSIIVTMLLMVSGILLSGGFNAWCSLMKENYGSCSDADYTDFKTQDLTIQTLGFNSQFNMAQFGVWVGWILWAFLAGCAAYQLYSYHRQEHFFESMTRERERLLQRVRPEPVVM